ncbi:MAG TPA: fumarylacetoacetate hydrolase family protein [Candidatus Acidoferrales bacterium]|nr:fumarylacetoacetate hydrolase family protein [Candidatus Acidoferrales bacterium]
MRLATFDAGRGARIGIIADDGTLVPLADLVPDAPADMLGIIAAGDPLHARLREVASKAHDGAKLSSVRLLAPIQRPARNVFCVGWNYSEHFAEGARMRAGSGAPGQQEIPEFPALFSKNPATVTGPDAPIWWPGPHSDELDWEVELAVVIGRGGRDISEADAMGHIFGYTCANDVSVRDVQRRHGGQWFKGKNFDSHLPLGPWIVSADALDPTGLRVQTRVNGVTKQDSNTRFMVFRLPRLVAEFSAGCELWPGDIIITGTPEGVGFARKPPEFMKIGDVVEVEIEGIGVLRNTVQGRT